MLNTIFFDNDGILVDTEPLYFEANRVVMKEAGFDLTLEKHIEHNMEKGLSVFDFLAKQNTPNIPALIEQRNKIYINLIQKKLIILPEVESTLQFLSDRGIQIGVVTSSRRPMFEAIHTQTGFDKYFDFVVDREDVTQSKPHPEPYLKALTIANRKPEEVVVIEDSARGLQATIAAGIDCWVISTAMTKHQDFSKAKKVLKNISEIKKNFCKV